MKPNYLENIPKNWEVKKLKYLFEFQIGWTPSTSSSSNFEGENTWVTIADLNKKYIQESKNNISNEAIDETNIKLVPKNALMYSFKLSIGKIAFAAKDLYTNEAILSILPNENYSLNFFYYALPLNLIKNANENIYGAKILNQDLINNAYLILPPLSTQQKIAHFLDQKTSEIDTLIHKKNKLIKLLQEEEKAFINEKITKGTNEVYPMKNSGIEWIGKIPKHWKISRMKNICKVRQGLQIPIDKRYLFKDNDSLEYITIRSINNPKQAKEYIKNPPKNVICNKDDILMARTGATGEVIINVAGVFHNNFFLVDYNRFIIDKMFLYYFLKSSLIKEHLLMVAGVTTIPDLNHKDFYNTPFFQFSLDEQNKIVEEIETHIDKNRQVVKKLSKEVDLLKEYRQSLISEAVTGQLVI